MRLLRGRVAVRLHEERGSTELWTPVVNERSTTSHRGMVLAHGPPQLTKRGAEVPPEFGVGDEVVCVFGRELVEKARRHTWTDGGECTFFTQDEIIAVVRGDHEPAVRRDA